MSARERAEELRRLAGGIRRCRRCRLHETRTRAVPGEGDADAAIMFVGEGPGEKEDAEGRPFVGRSGGFLDKVLADVGLRREELFVTSSVKCRPPGNRDPRRDELTACREAWLARQIECVRPTVIVLLGLTAIECVLGEKPHLADVHGRIRRRGDIRLLPTYHPTAGMRFPHIERRLRADLKKLTRIE